MSYNPDGTCAILRAITTYQKNAQACRTRPSWMRRRFTA
jgi:hypothetical protein